MSAGDAGIDSAVGKVIDDLAEVCDAALVTAEEKEADTRAAVEKLEGDRVFCLKRLAKMQCGFDVAYRAVMAQLAEIDEKLVQLGVKPTAPADDSTDEPEPAHADPEPPVATPPADATPDPTPSATSVVDSTTEVERLKAEVERLLIEAVGDRNEIERLRNLVRDFEENAEQYERRIRAKEIQHSNELKRLRNEALELKRQFGAASKKPTKPCWGGLAWLIALIGLFIGGIIALSSSESFFPDRHGVEMVVRSIMLLAIPTLSFLVGGAIGSLIEERCDRTVV